MMLAAQPDAATQPSRRLAELCSEAVTFQEEAVAARAASAARLEEARSDAREAGSAEVRE